ncbi:hypothetical protein CsSME_00026159 [Camellia sinensis var. sinensis]
MNSSNGLATGAGESLLESRLLRYRLQTLIFSFFQCLLIYRCAYTHTRYGYLHREQEARYTLEVLASLLQPEVTMQIQSRLFSSYNGVI